jgi:hypothetical protein
MNNRVLFLSIALVVLLVGMTGIITGEVTMLPSARNPEVYPTEGNWDDSFSYSVEVIFDTAIEVELWVWDPWFSDWINQGTARYSDTRKWERIYWNATKPFSEECVGMASKFKFKYAGIDLKARRDGRLVPLVSAGPRIRTTLPGVEFKTGSVSEGDATYLDELTYSINVKTTKAVDIELKVYDPCLGMWKSMEVLTASGGGGWEQLSWEKERPFFETNCKKGSSKFQFNAYYKSELINKSEIYPGPDLIPLIEYRNPEVEPGDGRYNWLFNYSVEIANVTEHVNPEAIKLEVLNPHTLTRTTFNQTGKINNTLMWSVRPFIDDPDCRGTAKYYFMYGEDRWPEVPCYGPEITPPPPPPIALDGWAESTTAERGDLKMEYYVHTGYVTPFNFTASSNSEVDLELLIRDPETGGLERRGDVQHCYAGGTVTWQYIEPFDSIKEDEIKDYIGQSFDFTFMYGGDVYARDFQGPELVVTFRNPECPTEVIYGEMFEYRIEVIAGETLNVTLQYDNGSTWNAVGDGKSYTDRKEWETLTWNCTATEQWQDVRFNWWGVGEGTEMEGTKLEVLQMKDKKPFFQKEFFSFTKETIYNKKSGYPVPVIVKEKK